MTPYRLQIVFENEEKGVYIRGNETENALALGGPPSFSQVSKLFPQLQVWSPQFLCVNKKGQLWNRQDWTTFQDFSQWGGSKQAIHGVVLLLPNSLFLRAQWGEGEWMMISGSPTWTASGASPPSQGSFSEWVVTTFRKHGHSLRLKETQWQVWMQRCDYATTHPAPLFSDENSILIPEREWNGSSGRATVEGVSTYLNRRYHSLEQARPQSVLTLTFNLAPLPISGNQMDACVDVLCCSLLIPHPMVPKLLETAQPEEDEAGLIEVVPANCEQIPLLLEPHPNLPFFSRLGTRKFWFYGTLLFFTILNLLACGWVSGDSSFFRWILGNSSLLTRSHRESTPASRPF